MGLTVYRLEGGYKSFRRWTNEILTQPREFLLLAGSTGVGKTAYLHRLIDTGEKVIDLEGLAHHKGSAFGAIGESESPTQSHFENKLAVQLWNYKSTGPIWLESESRRVGTCQIPPLSFGQTWKVPTGFTLRESFLNALKDCVQITKVHLLLNWSVLFMPFERGWVKKAYKYALQDLHENYRVGVVKRFWAITIAYTINIKFGISLES